MQMEGRSAIMDTSAYYDQEMLQRLPQFDPVREHTAACRIRLSQADFTANE